MLFIYLGSLGGVGRTTILVCLLFQAYSVSGQQMTVDTVKRNPCTCGKLINIDDAKQGNFPWTAAIVGKHDAHNEILCFGSLISTRLEINSDFFAILGYLYILSSAHCTIQFESVDIEVILNFHENKENPRRAVAKIKNHPGFTVGNYSFDNDISLLKLRDPVIFYDGQALCPVCLPPIPPPVYKNGNVQTNFSEWCADCDFVENPEERSMVMSKFTGYKVVKGFPYWVTAHTFDKTNIFTLKNSTCATLYPNRIKAQFLCGEVKNSNEPLPYIRNADLKTFCHDDPGSALIHLRKMKRGCDSDYETTKEKVKVRFVQIGISSDQKNCMLHYDKPVLLFTRIRRYLSWIKQNTLDGIYCENSYL